MQISGTPERTIALAPGAELNFGPSEDSDSVVVGGEALQGTVVGVAPGALVVTIAGEEQCFYYHQPERG